jgi:hypothetical protein
MAAMEHGSTTAALAGPRERRRVLALGALALWAITVPWLARAAGLALDVPTHLEVIDHVVPGVIVLGCCAALVHPVATGPPGSLLRLGVTAVACLSGFWITATHATLLPEAVDGISPWGTALLHLSAGPPITVLALWMLLADTGR